MTIYIIIITCAISFIGFSNPAFLQALLFEPYSINQNKQYYRFVTGGFLHADWMHLFVNMLVLYSFGQAVEYYYDGLFGTYSDAVFVLLYVSAIFAANVSTYFKHQNNSSFRSLGASGAVSAIVFAFILFAPYQKLYLFFALPLPAIVYGILYLVYEYTMSKRGNSIIHHEAHLEGAIYGMLFTIALKPMVAASFFEKLF
ncbi:MAG: rhomboid family intramembrane serine protease [Bacteroidia bacterium]|jgi:membrane associated rhomboid family serine protease|nr:rhomboid family intramembrane serine protease [Bacteroidia bacterium]